MIRAVGRALSIFDAFDQQHSSLSLQEIGKRIAMPKATTFRLVNTLEKTGFLVRLENQDYCLSLKLVRLAGLVRSTLSIRDICRPVMIEVNRLTGETITLNQVDGVHRLCVQVIDTPSPLMTIARPGDRIPLLFGATSRILLAHMEDTQRAAVLAGFPEGKGIERDALERELARFRRQAYAITRSQRVQGVTAIAVPLRDVHDEVHACLALTGPSGRVDAREADFVEIMLGAGADLSKRLGATPPATVATHDEAAPAAPKVERAVPAKRTPRRTPAGAARS